MAFKVKQAKQKVKMAVYKDGELVDFGVYDSMEEAKSDFKNYDKPRGRTAEFEYE